MSEATPVPAAAQEAPVLLQSDNHNKKYEALFVEIDPASALLHEPPDATNCQTPSLTEESSFSAQQSGNDLDQESLLPILGNRSLPPHRLHEKKSLGVVRYLNPISYDEPRVN